METNEIIYEVEAGRARIILNRPEKLNALNARIQQEIHDALWEADNDTSVHCVIIKGAGRAFCSGYDLTGGGNLGAERDPERSYRGSRSFDDDVWHLERMQRLLLPLFDMHKPSIAQVHGYCLAGGTGIIGLCDLVIAADDAVIGFPPARDLGVLPITTWLYNAGPQWAKRLILTGDTVTGAEAADIGLALKAVPADVLEAEVEQLADRLAHIDPDLLAANKRVINLGMELMGARTMQRVAAEIDARGHLAPSAKQWVSDVQDVGLHEVLRRRDAKFGDGRARVRGHERRDERGRLIDE
ncbi:MAG: crotonase/enoyl-CoA hydratase family protein [Acidimicrobiales bacterium]